MFSDPSLSASTKNTIAKGSWIVLLLCFLINAIDGIDVLSISYAASSLARAWRLSPDRIGFLLSAGLAGMTVGAIFLSPLADRVGRRSSIVLCLVVMTAGMAASAYSVSIWQLALARFATGIGIGAVSSNLIAIVFEFTPGNGRALTLGILGTGFPFGAALGGSLARWLIPTRGWTSVFLLGGLLSALMIPLILWRLPESIAFLLERRPANALKRLNRSRCSIQLPVLTQFPDIPVRDSIGSTALSLFGGESRKTLLLWAVVYFLYMASFYFILTWAAKLINGQIGASSDQGIAISSLITYGGVAGNLSAGFLTRIWGKRQCAIVFLVLMAILIALFPVVMRSGFIANVFAVTLGWSMWSSLITMYTLTAGAFSAAVRSTGLGMALGAGRIGSVLGPYLCGIFLASGLSVMQTCLILALPALAAALLMASTRAEQQAYDSMLIGLDSKA